MTTKSIAINVAVATIVYWLVMTAWETGGLSGDALVGNIFQAVSFAMFYAAVLVATKLVRSRKK